LLDDRHSQRPEGEWKRHLGAEQGKCHAPPHKSIEAYPMLDQLPCMSVLISRWRSDIIDINLGGWRG
jgi:hypothetical protein